jgi:excisionase family DNA binding protein
MPKPDEHDPRIDQPAALDLDALAEAVARKVAEQLAGRPAPRYMTVAQTAVYTGLSADSVRSLLAGGKLTALRPVPGRVVIDRQELDAYLRASTRRPRSGRGLNRPRNRGAGGAPVNTDGQHRRADNEEEFH